jgi:hypothetical protein
MHSLGINEKNTKILDMKAGIRGIFSSQVQLWKTSDLYHTIFSACNIFKKQQKYCICSMLSLVN